MRLADLLLLAMSASLMLSSCATTANRAEVELVQGYVAPGYEQVKLEFERNLRTRGELGGAFAAYVDGELVVDLWGGWADPARTRAWEENTLVPVFSATKGVAAMVLAHLHSRGLLDYDERVSTYWPEFAAAGKPEVTVRQLLAHQAGIVLTDRPLQARHPEEAIAAVAAARPLWTPGEQHGYHAATIGFAMQALVQRLDPEQRTIDAYLQQEINPRLATEFYIGLDPAFDRSRLAEVRSFSPLEAMRNLGKLPPGMGRVILNPRSLFWRSLGETVDVNSPLFTTGEDPSGNGIGDARSLAGLYAALLRSGEDALLSETTRRELFGPAERPRAGYRDRVMNIETHYRLGFMKANPATGWFSPHPGSIGFLGASGALGFADDAHGIAAAYVTNRMAPGTQIDDPRERALRHALYRAARGIER